MASEPTEIMASAKKYVRRMPKTERAAFLELFDEHWIITGWSSIYSKFERDGLLDIHGSRLAMSPLGKQVRAILEIAR